MLFSKLLGEKALLFEEELERAQKAIQASSAKIVCIAKKEPIHYLAFVLASMQAGCMTVLADPTWQKLEWESIFKDLRPDLIVSDTDIACSKSGPCKDYSPWFGFLLIPTGGSTGGLRFAMHTWDNLRSSACASLEFLKQETLSNYSMLPPWHISGLMPFLRSYFSGGSYRYISPKSLDILLETVVVPNAFLSVVPTLLGKLMQEDALCNKLRDFQGIFVGGASISKEMICKALDLSLPILPTYGLTETASMVALHDREDGLITNGQYSGRALPHATLSLKKRGLKASTLRIRATSLFYGYYPDIPIKKEFLDTQDLATIDENNCLHIQGRNDAIVITGGKKVSPNEVQEAFIKTGLVKECVVFGAADPKWGKALAVAYVLIDKNTSKEVIWSALRPLLAPYKIPKLGYALDKIPLNDRNKVDLRSLLRLLQSAS